MSGLMPYEMLQFYRRLRARGVTTSTLAVQVGVSRPRLCQVLNGARRRGPIWARVQPLLEPEEIRLLDVVQRHPWNKQRIKKRPKWAAVRRQLQSVA